MKNITEVARESMGDILDRYFPAQFLRHGCDRLGGDSARDDEIEKLQVRGDVECEAVGRNSARDVHTEGGDFRLPGVGRTLTDPRSLARTAIAWLGSGPNSRQARDSLGRDSEQQNCG